jgi:hypothetical protein
MPQEFLRRVTQIQAGATIESVFPDEHRHPRSIFSRIAVSWAKSAHPGRAGTFGTALAPRRRRGYDRIGRDVAASVEP